MRMTISRRDADGTHAVHLQGERLRLIYLELGLRIAGVEKTKGVLSDRDGRRRRRGKTGRKEEKDEEEE